MTKVPAASKRKPKAREARALDRSESIGAACFIIAVFGFGGLVGAQIEAGTSQTTGAGAAFAALSVVACVCGCLVVWATLPYRHERERRKAKR